MKKSESSNSGDRLSELPDSLIFEIFWFLPMRDVVRTTILSQRWNNLWITAPCLNFEDFKFETDTDRVRNFVNRALIMWRGARIQKFKIDFGTHLNKSLHSDIDFWLHFATKYQVEFLVVDLRYLDHIIPSGTIGAEQRYWAPQCLYSCSSLKDLTLTCCNLHIPSKNVHWNQLKKLTIYGYEVSAGLIEQVLCGTPQLEVLILYLMETHENLSIQSTSLIHLFVHKYLYYAGDDSSIDTELRISTPNLEKLELVGIPYNKCLVNDVPSLSYAKLCFYGNDFVGEALKQILPAIQHVEQLVLSDWCIQALGDVKNNCTLSPFWNVYSLELHGCFEEYEELVRLLEIFPNLESLFLRHKTWSKQFYGGGSLEFEAIFLIEVTVTWEANLPSSVVQELFELTVSWDESDGSIFRFIEILLKYESNPDIVVKKTATAPPPSNSLVLASEKVMMRMPISYLNAQMTFFKDFIQIF